MTREIARRFNHLYGREENFEKKHKKKPDWFTSHGDVFPVRAKMKPFPPVAPNGQRSFPTKRLTRGINQWNHYYIRAINGEVRLWVNGEEVGYSQGSKTPAEFRVTELLRQTGVVGRLPTLRLDHPPESHNCRPEHAPRDRP